MSALLVLTWLTPLLVAALTPRPRFWWLSTVTALPALAAAVLVPTGHQVEIPWLLLGTVLGLDETGRIFLAFTSVLWLAAGLYGAGSMRRGPDSGRFQSLFLLAMAGNFWLIVGLDLVSFYLGFSLMGLASYGLVVHDGDRMALRAGKVYVIMTIAAELALFVALVLIADHAGGLVPSRTELAGLGDLTVGLLLFGLAIKAGLVPVHVWLPLAHPAAPVPASAVLSGAMIKVALLGWLRFLPVGAATLTEWGLLLLVLGMLTLLYAIPVGLVQSNPKVILAYSSVSKMGLMSTTLGLMLLEPTLAVAGVTALSLYAAHHALVKGGLFLGVGLRHLAAAQGLVLAGTVLLALSLAGVPASGGAIAKYGIKPILGGTGWTWVTTAVTLSAAGTALLMARFLWVIWRTEPHPSSGQVLGFIGWAMLIALSLVFPLLLGDGDAWGTDAFPVAAALIIVVPFALAAWRKPHLLRPVVDVVPAGDLLGLVRPVLSVLGFMVRGFGRGWSSVLRWVSAGLDRVVATVGPAPSDPERGLRSWPNAGAAWLIITASLLVLPLVPLTEPSKPVVAVDGPATPVLEAGEVAASSESLATASGLGVEAKIPPPITDVESTSAREETPESFPGVLDAQELPAGAPESEEIAASASHGSLESAAPPVAPDTSLPSSDETRASEPGPRTADPPCDPDRRFVLRHPNVPEALRLVDCLRSESGATPLDAPPVTNQLVLLVQCHLNDLGYDAGPTDGLIGPRTREAIRRFQHAEGRRTTGTISYELLRDLLRVRNESTRP
jgi:formate hydrogenlyase subunit 3/multisubunit Na+/H+ antiporter MnhD subunit